MTQLQLQEAINFLKNHEASEERAVALKAQEINYAERCLMELKTESAELRKRYTAATLARQRMEFLYKKLFEPEAT